MFCKYCGKEIVDGAKYCKYCGKSLGSTPNPDNGSKADDPMQQVPKTNLNTRVLNTLEREFHVDPGRDIRNFTTFHGLGFWGPAAGVIACAILSFIVSAIGHATNSRHPALTVLIIIAMFAFAAWAIVIVVRIFQSAFGITDTSLLVRIWPSQKYEIPLDQIEKVSVGNIPFSRAGICGDLRITTKEKAYCLKSVGNVNAFKNTLVQQLSKLGIFL